MTDCDDGRGKRTALILHQRNTFSTSRWTRGRRPILHRRRAHAADAYVRVCVRISWLVRDSIQAMKVAGLFAGIGGFELGLAESGHEAELLCDILPTAQSVLKHRFPGSELVADIVDMSGLPSDIEIVTAGFPCQDLSQAGNTAGLAGHRSGLIGEVFRLLEKRKKARRPVPWVVVENVPFMLQLGGGGPMRAIIDEFERLKYRWAYRVVDTNGFGLPQRRERVYLVATTQGEPEDVLLADDNPLLRPATDLGKFAHGFYWTEGRGGLGWAVDAVPTLKNGSTIGIASPPAVLMRNGAIVKPGIRAAEALQGFAPDWTQAAEMVAKPSHRDGRPVGFRAQLDMSVVVEVEPVDDSTRIVVPFGLDAADRPCGNGVGKRSLGQGSATTVTSR